jgi:hypothetical protein
MNNTASRIIRSEEITIDMRICTILAGGKKPGEVYFAAIAPDMELTVITLDEVPDILPCFDESDVSINLPDTSLLLTYNPAQVLKLAGKRYLTGPVILVRTNMDSDFRSPSTMCTVSRSFWQATASRSWQTITSCPASVWIEARLCLIFSSVSHFLSSAHSAAFSWLR